MEDDLISRKLFVTAPGLDFTDIKALKDKCEIHGVVEEVNFFTEKEIFTFFSAVPSGDCPGGEKLWFCYFY